MIVNEFIITLLSSLLLHLSSTSRPQHNTVEEFVKILDVPGPVPMSTALRIAPALEPHTQKRLLFKGSSLHFADFPGKP